MRRRPFKATDAASQKPDKYNVATWWEAIQQHAEVTIRLELLKDWITRESLVFDIGANRGAMTLMFRRLGARVVAVEPLAAVAPATVKELFVMFEDDPKVTILPVAVSNEVGLAKMLVHTGWPYLSTIDMKWAEKSAHSKYYNENTCREEFVHTVTLDDLIDAYGTPDFVKIDVEGHEEEVVLGLTQPIPFLSLEYHADWIPLNALSRLDVLSCGKYASNYTFSEFGYTMKSWGNIPNMLKHLKNHVEESGKYGWGDIYVKECEDA